MNGKTGHFKIGEWGAFRREWQRLFPNIMLLDMYDGLMTLVNGYITIDPVALDRRLESLYPEDYESMSIAGIIEKHYGENAKKLIENAI